MSSKDQIIDYIEKQLSAKISKQEIAAELSTKFEDSNKYLKILEKYIEPKLKEKYKVLIIVLTTAIVLLNLIKLANAVYFPKYFSFFSDFHYLEIKAWIWDILMPLGAIAFLQISLKTDYYLIPFLYLIYEFPHFTNVFVVLGSNDVTVISCFFVQFFVLILICSLNFYLWKKFKAGTLTLFQDRLQS